MMSCLHIWDRTNGDRWGSGLETLTGRVPGEELRKGDTVLGLDGGARVTGLDEVVSGAGGYYARLRRTWGRRGRGAGRGGGVDADADCVLGVGGQVSVEARVAVRAKPGVPAQEVGDGGAKVLGEAFTGVACDEGQLSLHRMKKGRYG